jgi:hypothetical protein
MFHSIIPQFTVSEQMQLHDHFARFRTALDQLGASAEEVFNNLRSIAVLWLAQGKELKVI